MKGKNFTLTYPFQGPQAFSMAKRVLICGLGKPRRGLRVGGPLTPSKGDGLMYDKDTALLPRRDGGRVRKGESTEKVASLSKKMETL